MVQLALEAKGARVAIPVRDKMVACLTGPNLSYDIRFSGLELDQGDLDVWEAVLYSTSTTPLGTVSRVSRRGLQRRLGRNPKKGERLYAQLEKLLGAVVRTREKRGHQVYGYSGSLCSVDWAESLVSRDAKYAISIPPTMAELFGSSQYTFVNWEGAEGARSGPSRSVVARLLLVPPLPAAVLPGEAPRALWLENAELRSFRQKVKKALVAFGKATEKHGESFVGSVDEGDRVLAAYSRKPASSADVV
ncbi:MAG: hypothetical protein AAGD10_10485 [Myxococcota bacterium]